MAECANAQLHSLSSGQLQRVLFARLLLQDGQLILLDEPFNAVDARTSAELISLIDQWRDEGRTVIAVLHDLPLARAHFPEALLLARHCLGWGPTEQVLTTDTLGRARLAGQHWHSHRAA
jgi:zinc/manganese transport system ATP-binding protein